MRQLGTLPLRSRIIGLGGLLIVANLAAWGWALLTFRQYPLALGTAVLAYSFGLRHAFDADHIAAIDNVTRKLMQQGERPVGVGLFFSLGHSAVVVLASVAVALLAAAFKGPLASLRDIGGVLATLFSSGFLLLIAAMNCAILAGIWRRFRAVRAGQLPPTEDAGPLSGGGPLARIFRPLFRLIRRSWHMLPLGFLFGLGFDTASEIGLLGLAAAEASKGMPIWSILVFPALFTAGMALVDAADSVLMLGAYGWAFARPVRRLFYNLVITGVSVLVALVVGGIEALGLLRDQLDLQGVFWDAIDGLNDHFDMLGYLIVGLFMASWLVSVLVYRLGGFDALDREHSAG